MQNFPVISLDESINPHAINTTTNAKSLTIASVKHPNRVYRVQPD